MTRSPPVTLSAVAIAKNEGVNLPALVRNLEGWTDEVVIVDDHSTDGSIETLMQSRPDVRLVRHRMTEEGGFSGQRNAGIAAASGDWLLHMDCDERVSAELARSILSAIQATDLNAFRYRRLNFFLHRPMRHGGWSSWNRPQLARNGSHHFEGILHEACVIAGGEPATGQLSGYMAHLNDTSFAHRMEKSHRYSITQSVEIVANEKDIGGARILSRTVIEFLKKYVVQRGLLDGTPGLISALHSATAVFRAHALAWDAQNRIERSDLEEEIARQWTESKGRDRGGEQ